MPRSPRCVEEQSWPARTSHSAVASGSVGCPSRPWLLPAPVSPSPCPTAVIAGSGKDLGFPARWAWLVLILRPRWSPALQKPGCAISPGCLRGSHPTRPTACGLQPWLFCPHCPPGGPPALLLDEDHPPGGGQPGPCTPLSLLLSGSGHTPQLLSAAVYLGALPRPPALPAVKGCPLEDAALGFLWHSALPALLSGMQFILLQEILPPLCPGQRGCFPSGNSARLGEKESPLHEACQPAQFSTMSAVGYQVRSGAHPGLVAMRASVAQVRDGAEMEPLCWPSFWATGSRVCSPGGWGLPAATPASGAGRDGAHRQTPDARAQGPQPLTHTAPTLAAGETLMWACRVPQSLEGRTAPSNSVISAGPAHTAWG